MAAFLVERYLPPAAAGSLAASVARLAKICAADLEVHYLQAAHLLGDDTCFCLFRAPSSEAVRRVNAAAEFPLDRITEAVLLDCAAPGPTRSPGEVQPGVESSARAAE